ncbi:leucine--tRNA ligase [Halobacteriales archaeon QS_4_69_34]|nr:MAG: leucine--tRNA ligase [Halobacteriales archaeon QS_4_69_34]
MQHEHAYDHAAIESRWQARWADADVYRMPDNATDPAYVLSMFPYPSGDLHMGHVRNYTITDAYARYQRMCGEQVLHPMGWDSFGLPAENAAIERETHPREWTLDCIDTMRDQMQRMGFGIDWEREITTCEPEYYRWNQWLFKRFHEAGLAERKGGEVNWCRSCETVLADEQVEGEAGETPEESHGDGGAAGVCWRCGTPVETRTLDQWFLRITEYADELLDAIDDLEGWPENVKGMQRNWIGRQKGATVEFDTAYGPVEVFTTRLDTLYGATFFALAPNHGVTREIVADDPDLAAAVDDLDSAADGEGKRGVFTGEHAINPATGEKIPIYVAEFVLADVGTGALMGVPGHDERDHEFAVEHDIEIRQVVAPAEAVAGDGADANGDETGGVEGDGEADDTGGADGGRVDVREAAYTADGVLVNSGEYDGLSSAAARDRLVENLDSAAHEVQYRLRDWLISRQRYWGTPIPVVHCPDCGPVLVPDEELPVELPEFVPTPTGNPLEEVESFVHTECPDCGAPAHRETDTMDTFVDSSWYFLRFVSPHSEDAPFDTERATDWLPVDRYVGGVEHAVMHLLYARFFMRVLDDLGLLGVEEPFERLTNHGMVLLDDAKMSKSKGNVVSPEEILEQYGADTARLFMMGVAGPETEFNWTERGVRSSHAFLERLLETARGSASEATEARGTDEASEESTTGETNGTGEVGERPIDEYVARETDAAVAAATADYEAFRFDDALREARSLVSLLGRYRDRGPTDHDVFERGLRTAIELLAPVVPHVAEECWDVLGGDGLVAAADWPTPTGDAAYEAERRLVENTREDVRHILDVAGIDDPETIEVVVAPDWKHRALELASEGDGDAVGAVMADPELRERGEAAAEFAKSLDASYLSGEHLSPDREFEALSRAAWLVREEFDTDVRVERAADADEELAGRARPDRPAIEIYEA